MVAGGRVAIPQDVPVLEGEQDLGETGAVVDTEDGEVDPTAFDSAGTLMVDTERREVIGGFCAGTNDEVGDRGRLVTDGATGTVSGVNERRGEIPDGDGDTDLIVGDRREDEGATGCEGRCVVT